MRTILAATLLLALACCGEGSAFDQNFRNGIREGGVNACTRDAREALIAAGRLTAAAEADARTMCACIVERTMASASTSELVERSSRDKTDAERAEEERITTACAAELGLGEAAGSGERGSMSECLRRPARTAEERQQRDLECAQGAASEADAPGPDKEALNLVQGR